MRQLLDDLPIQLRSQALRHPSFADTHADSFERLEFLGDSVLDLAISDALYRTHPEMSEGELSRIRGIVVSRESCEVVAREHALGDEMVSAAADGANGARSASAAERVAGQRNTLAALVESVIGAAFLTHGWEYVAPHIVESFMGRVEFALENRIDPRSHLQELADQLSAPVSFAEAGAEGPPHDRTFTFTVTMEPSPAGAPARTATGRGRSKQEAQQRAAAAMLEMIEVDDEGAGSPCT